jgi:stage II sporulation protein M
MALIVNGWILAIVSTIVVEEESLGFVLAALLPHGIIEIPALMLGEAAALSFGATITLSLFNREKRKLVMPNLKQNLKYLSLAISLLLPAAIIETYVTPLFLS